MTEIEMTRPLPATDHRVDVESIDVDAFAARGFLAVPQITSNAEIAWLREIYDALIDTSRSGFLDGVFDLSRPYGTTDEPRLGQLLLPERFVADLAATAVCRNARAIVARLLAMPEDALEMWSHLIFKAPHSAAVTPWHQDEAYWDVHLRYHTVAAWLALDDVDTANGCLWYVPGSHLGAVRRHRHLGGDPSVHVLEVDEPVDTRGAEPVPLAAGGMVFHHPRTLHYAGPNETAAMRRAWGVVFQTAPIPREHPVDHPWWHEGRQAHADRLRERSSGGE